MYGKCLGPQESVGEDVVSVRDAEEVKARGVWLLKESRLGAGGFPESLSERGQERKGEGCGGVEVKAGFGTGEAVGVGWGLWRGGE
jgi:hypothetical protein